jgi:glycosyltransferase involved in cell wall biosynthesis
VVDARDRPLEAGSTYSVPAMRVLFFGTYDTGTHPRVAVLRDGLSATLGAMLVDGKQQPGSVDECNVPLGLSTAARVSILRRPWLLPLLALRLATCWLTLARRARRRPRPDALVVGYLGHFDVLLARRLFRGVPIVLDHLVGASDTASDRGVSGGVRQRLLRALDRRALAAANVVVVDTEEHLAALPEPARAKAVVVAVGAPAGWFVAAPLERSADQPLSVVFFGLYTPLQGTPTIGAALAALSGAAVDVTMIGSGQDLALTRQLAAANDRVTWRDWVDPAELPDVVAGHDVCLGIFGTGAKARRVVPNKVFQGAAAGAALVTSDTAPQRRALGDAAIFVPPGDGAALAAALRDLTIDRDRLAALRSAAHRLALDEFAPERVVEPLAARLRLIMKDRVRSRGVDRS